MSGKKDIQKVTRRRMRRNILKWKNAYVKLTASVNNDRHRLEIAGIERRAKMRMRRRAFRWQLADLKVDTANKVGIRGFRASRKELSLAHDPEARSQALTYFQENPQMAVDIFSVEDIDRIDDGGNFEFLYPPSLSHEEIRDIESDCEVRGLDCRPDHRLNLDGSRDFSRPMVFYSPELPSDSPSVPSVPSEDSSSVPPEVSPLVSLASSASAVSAVH